MTMELTITLLDPDFGSPNSLYAKRIMVLSLFGSSASVNSRLTDHAAIHRSYLIQEAPVTSEVLILNKRAVVLGADSAVTTSGGEHPRYSKSANKIFEISGNGRIAAAIYGNANIDLVPWELVLKLFRIHLGAATFNTVKEYSGALVAFLSGNDQLFPPALRASWVEQQFDTALKLVLEEATRSSPNVTENSVPLEDRAERWAIEAARIRALLDPSAISHTLSQALDDVLSNIGPWVTRAQDQLDSVPELAAVNAADLAELGHKLRYVLPKWILGNTGLVIAGYGEEQIFPAYEQLEVYGHIGDEFCYKSTKSFEVTHTGHAEIQPLAQTSMIDMFTDGFGTSLERIIDRQGKAAFEKVLSALAVNGITVPSALADSITQQCHSDFMMEWKRENWKQNFHPLIGVLQNLSVGEMAHLAESLLGLESLKERVTSASESVGGPIDVAVITKSEGLIWIKRKHYFDAKLNMRYAMRLEHSLE